MYDFECSSDSNRSTIKENNDLFNTSKQDNDHDSDSTIIIEANLDSSDCINNQFRSISTFSDDKFTALAISPNQNSTNNITCLDDKFKCLNKPAISSYCKKGKSSSYVSKDKIDPELESILLKYSSPPIGSTSTNRNCSLEGIATGTFTNNGKNELIELSSDEDEDLPQIQIKTSKLTPTIIQSQIGKGRIDVDNGELSKKYEQMFNEEHEAELPSFQIKNSRLGSITFERDLTVVDTEQQLSKESTQMLDEDEDLPQFNIKNHKQTSTTSSTKATETANESIPDVYKSPKKKRKLNSEDNKKMDKATLQAKKREEAERAKNLKQALLAANKNMKPEECIKFITVLLDSEVANESYGGEVLNALQAADITYQLKSQLIPNTITWNRRVETHLMDKDEQLTPTSESVETSEVLLILKWKQVAELVHSRTLVTHVKSLQSILANKKLLLAIHGMENYFKYQKSQKHRDMRSEITQTSQKTNKYDKTYKDVPRIGKKQLESALTELQLLCCCCHRMVETVHDVGTMIVQFTKAIAQAPYKLEKQRKQQEEEWYISGDNKDCVRVDKNGNGLQRLWQQQLTTFPLARLEHAEAIVAKYPSPTSLMKEYSHCTQMEGEKLLQDIPIRRAAGPLTTVRKIGPELSKKIFKFFTSSDGNTVL